MSSVAYRARGPRLHDALRGSATSRSAENTARAGKLDVGRCEEAGARTRMHARRLGEVWSGAGGRGRAGRACPVSGKETVNSAREASLPFFLVLSLLSPPRTSLPFFFSLPLSKKFRRTLTPRTAFAIDIASLYLGTPLRPIRARSSCQGSMSGCMGWLRLLRRYAVVHRCPSGCTARGMRHLMPARRGAKLARCSRRRVHSHARRAICASPVPSVSAPRATVGALAHHARVIERDEDDVGLIVARLEAQGTRGFLDERTRLHLVALRSRAIPHALCASAGLYALCALFRDGGRQCSAAAVETYPLPKTRGVLPGPLGRVGMLGGLRAVAALELCLRVRDGRVHLGNCTAAWTRKYQVVLNVSIVFFRASILEIAFSSLGINASRFAQEDRQ
ncbi:hypothetical protein FB451DRAFT_1555638 [Mycena latifolia]|nr:hypothetical protein FB451DRAFT_1555638 [Mycena latifolia]